MPLMLGRGLLRGLAFGVFLFRLFDAGLFFLAYQRSPEQFVTLQRALSTDLMSEYVKHIGSGVWAVPPGATAGSYVGAGLFA